jgi:hypothetical protein
MDTHHYGLNLILALLVVFSAAPSCGKDRCPGEVLTEIRSLEKLPTPLRRLLPNATRGLDGIADRGGPFNATDAVTHDFPMRRFTLAAVGATCAVIAVEYGGRGHGFELTEYRSTDVGWHSIARYIVYDEPKSTTDLLTKGQRAAQ